MIELLGLFTVLAGEAYEAHPFHTLKNPVNDGLPSDCQDRAYFLAGFAKEMGLNPSFMWLVWYKNQLTSHVVVLIDGKVFDPTWHVNGEAVFFDYDKQDYLKYAEPDFKFETPYWFRHIIP